MITTTIKNLLSNANVYLPLGNLSGETRFHVLYGTPVLTPQHMLPVNYVAPQKFEAVSRLFGANQLVDLKMQKVIYFTPN